MISCIITTYKRPVNILKRAIDSVINQTYKDIELIVVNDAPNEKKLVEEIAILINEYKIPKQYIVHEKNQGACAARNTGIKHANGEFIAFLDDDDEWLPEKLSVQMKMIEESGAALVYCSHYEVDKEGKENLVVEEFARVGIHNDDFDRLLCYNYVGSTSYPLIRIEAVKDVGGFTIGLKSSQDHDLWLRIAEKYPIAYCDKPLVRYFYSEEAISRSMTNKLQGYEFLLNKYATYYSKHKKVWNYRLNYLAYCCLKFHSFKNCLKYWLKAIRVKFFSKYNFMILTKIINKIKE